MKVPNSWGNESESVKLINVKFSRKNETAWKKNNDWKTRYAKLYSTRQLSRPQEDETRRISFMSNDSTPYTSLLIRMRATRRDSSIYGPETSSPEKMPSTVSQQIEYYDSYVNSLRSDSLGGHETILLDMVRRRSQESENEGQDKTLDLPGDDISEDNCSPTSDACMHGMSMRMTERSVSRSRFSRASTRRDMDIPSILAFSAPSAPGPTVLEIPAFQKTNTSQKENIPRWSIRRSVCPVCSQKWKDNSSINMVKYSGLKRSCSSDLPTVIAPARLRASITMAYAPRPILAAIDENVAISHLPMRNTSAAWQFTRARRFRTPKPQIPPPEATAPPSSTAPMARKDLDTRVNKFLSDETLLKYIK